jgi:hypothetical protein
VLTIFGAGARVPGRSWWRGDSGHLSRWRGAGLGNVKHLTKLACESETMSFKEGQALPSQ